jgi:hypothetical protein
VANKSAVGGGALVLLVIAAPLWNEFRVPGNGLWNAFLAMFLIGLAGSALLLGRYFYLHSGEIGEARFDTRNEVDR